MKSLRPSFFVDVPHSGRWEETSAVAWRELVRFGMGYRARYYGLICDTYAQPDSRITRYFKLRRRKILADLYAGSREYGEEITIERKEGLIFADIIGLTNDSGPILLDISRTNRRSFVMASLGYDMSRDEIEGVKSRINTEYTAGRTISIDDDRTPSFFDELRLFTVRSLGEFDDRYLSLSL